MAGHYIWSHVPNEACMASLTAQCPIKITHIQFGPFTTLSIRTSQGQLNNHSFTQSKFITDLLMSDHR